jgi:FAD/FMN-containing dehydrogenase
MQPQLFTSWGRLHRVSALALTPASRFDALPLPTTPEISVLPYGNGRSYGDSCLNANGAQINSRALNRFIAFEPDTGLLRCEAGVLLADILDLTVPQGWFLPVTPGTRFVTVGGAIGNDVHGKNHHVMGTFGRHIRQFELWRSDGQRLLCSPQINSELFAATIGGLGLTGFISWAELQLRRIRNPLINVESIRYTSLDEFFALCVASDLDYEYTVSWVDCAGSGARLGRGLFIRGNHAPSSNIPSPRPPKVKTFPAVPPVSLVNPLTLKAFNNAYYYKQLPKHVRLTQHYEPFFYPLDALLQWNRLYGPRGFYQYQCVIPHQHGQEAIAALLREIARSGLGSFLAVLKVCGDIDSPGMLSFPLPGVSLALDFPNRGEKLFQLFERLDAIISESGGRLYPAKDSRMSGNLFKSGYPQWEAFTQYIDPRFSSSFWRRILEHS